MNRRLIGIALLLLLSASILATPHIGAGPTAVSASEQADVNACIPSEDMDFPQDPSRNEDVIGILPGTENDSVVRIVFQHELWDLHLYARDGKYASSMRTGSQWLRTEIPSRVSTTHRPCG